jgi:hypothetical protein
MEYGDKKLETLQTIERTKIVEKILWNKILFAISQFCHTEVVINHERQQ